jgi:hypothetical protein
MTLIRKLEFEEIPLNSGMKKINCYCDKIFIIGIEAIPANMSPHGKETYYLTQGLFECSIILQDHNEVIRIYQSNKSYFSEGEAKDAAQRAFEKYINLFLNIED